jgi:dTDP-4-amino-4,6-dideoxygalactose transaminase
VAKETTVSIARPSFNDVEERAVIEVIRSGWVSQGPKVITFEQALSRYVGVKHGRAVNSGTGAIHLALLASGIKPGDKVIVPAFTCVAALHPLEVIGAEPTLVDVELDTFGLDPNRLADVITHDAKAVMVAHLFGHPANIADVMQLVSARDVVVIEDAALGLAAKVGERFVGSFGHVACLSFHPRKIITTGEGGMVLTDSDEVASAVARMRNYGASVAAIDRHHGNLFDLPEYNDVGYNFKMTDIQAAVGLEQSKKLPSFVEIRREMANRYDDAFAGLSWLRLPSQQPLNTHVYQSYVCLLDLVGHGIEETRQVRNRFLDHLGSYGVASVQAAQAMPTIAFYRRKYGWRPQDFPNAIKADAGSVALPIYPGLSRDSQDRVIDAVRCFVP